VIKCMRLKTCDKVEVYLSFPQFCIEYTLIYILRHFVNSFLHYMIINVCVWWCLTPLSIQFQLYRGGQC
jgi:hypothetical protein